MRACRRVIIWLAGLSLLPMAAILLTAALAAAFGCEVIDDAPTQCLVLGANAGGLLSGLLSIGSLVHLTIPFLMLLLAAWAVVEGLAWARQRRKVRRALRSVR